MGLRKRNKDFDFFHKYSIFNIQYSISSGFTLLEVLISLTIMGLILVIIFASLRIGVRAWEKGERDVDTHQRQRIVLGLMKQQISSACMREVEVGTGKPFMLRGDDRTLEFVSRIPVIPDNRAGMAYVKYAVQEDGGSHAERLAFFEKNIVFLGKDQGMETPEEDDFLVLIPGMDRLRFEYLKAPEDDEEQPQWQEGWDAEADEGLPLAVRLTFREAPETAPVHVIARIESEEG